MASFDDVRRLGAELPGVVEATSYHGSPALKVGNRLVCRLWSEQEQAREAISGSPILVVFCDPQEKELLIEASEGQLFSTPHYDGHPTVLVRLGEVSTDLLIELLEDSYRSRAPRRLVAEFDRRSGRA